MRHPVLKASSLPRGALLIIAAPPRRLSLELIDVPAFRKGGVIPPRLRQSSGTDSTGSSDLTLPRYGSEPMLLELLFRI